MAVTLEEYLHTSYSDGDLEFVDGELMERNIGEIPHADAVGRVMMLMCDALSRRRVTISVRTQVSATRVRVPDLMLLPVPRPRGPILVEPPDLIVEVLSPDDRVLEFEEKVADYLAFGVPYVWAVDPYRRRAFVYQPGLRTELTSGELRHEATGLTVPLEAIWNDNFEEDDEELATNWRRTRLG